MNIIGLDPSLTHTAGWCSLTTAQGPSLRSFAIKTRQDQFTHGIARLLHIRDTFAAQLGTCGAPGQLLIEGYAYGAKCDREALGELGGVLRLVAYEHGWSVVVVPPAVLKAFVAGKGNAPKEQIILGVFKRWAYSASDNNDADAYALMRMGLEYVGPREAVTKERAALLAKLEVLRAA